MELFKNPVLWGVAVMLVLASLRMNVVVALLLGTLAAGLRAGLSIAATLEIFRSGLNSGASIAVNYALLGSFACVLAHSGIAEWFLRHARRHLIGEKSSDRRIRRNVLLLLLTVALLCKNFLPVHVAFIPILVPPLLEILARVRLDRRAVACTLTFGLVASYMILPVGFGHIFLRDILLENLRINGLSVDLRTALKALTIPFLGMVLGLLVAIRFTYGKPRTYAVEPNLAPARHLPPNGRTLILALLALCVAFAVQIFTAGGMLLGMLLGLLIFWLGGAIRTGEIDRVVGDGIRMMASIGVTMIVAAGFASVLRATGGIESLIAAMVHGVHGSRCLAALAMLTIGLTIASGIGSSFATVPVVAALYVPLCSALNFSPAATVAVVALSAIPGDPASPASNSTLGASAGLAVDGQFQHMRDCVLPSFLHVSLPALIFGWLAAMVL